jgi:hypothetical protein
MSRPAVGPTKLPMQWVLGFFPVVRCCGNEVGHSSHVVLKFRMNRAVCLLPFYGFLALTGTVLPFFYQTANYTPRKFSKHVRCCLVYTICLNTGTSLARKKHCFVCVCVCVYVCVCFARWLSSDGHVLFIVTAADPNAWRLGRIEEGDRETPV